MVVFSLGPERVREALRKALALGAARAVHLVARRPSRAATRWRPGARSPRRSAREPFDLVLTGSQSDDLGCGATGSVVAGRARLAARLAGDGHRGRGGRQSLRVVREMESGENEIFRVALPAVLEVQAGINHPRYASLKGIMAAKKKEIAESAPADLGLDAGDGRRRRLAARDRLGRLPGERRAARRSSRATPAAAANDAGRRSCATEARVL